MRRSTRSTTSSPRTWLATERLDGWIAHNATEREEYALRAQFQRWLGAGQGAGDDPGRLARTPPLPDDLEGVLAWARSHDLLGELTLPASEVLADRSGTPDNRSLLESSLADYVLHMDPWWNPAAEDQASDRAHRLGQDRPLTIVKLVASGTIEEQVLALHQHKRKLADNVLTGASVTAPLDAAALEALLAAIPRA